jgi:spore coat protein H
MAGGVSYQGVKVRARGAWSRGWPKKSLKILFDHQQPFAGHNSLDLNSAWHDPAFLRETLAYHIYAACGAPASTSRLARLDINGQFRGLYVEVEVPGKSLLHRLDLKGASLYKAISRGNTADERDLGSPGAYASNYKKETQTAEGYDELARFCRELNRAAKPLDFFTQHVDLEKYINYLAGSVLLQNWDGYNKNHYLVYDGHGSQKWFVVPWDLDRTLGDFWNFSFEETRLPVQLGTRQAPGITGWNRMADRFFSDPTLRARFFDRLAELLEKEFTSEKLVPFLDRLESDITPEAKLDRGLWPSQNSDFHRAIAQVKKYIERRRAFLLAELPKWRRTE